MHCSEFSFTSTVFFVYDSCIVPGLLGIIVRYTEERNGFCLKGVTVDYFVGAGSVFRVAQKPGGREKIH